MQKNLNNVLFIALLAGVLGAGTRAGAELVLVENGVGRAPIVVFENAPPKTRQAAEELADYIERTTGARLDVIEGEPAPLPERAIWVGYQPALDGLFPDLDFDFQKPEQILIAANGAHLVIAGRDRWHPDHLEVEGRSWTIEGKQMEYGTVNAVYTFLQEYLDVRWLWPGESGVDIVARDTLAFAPFAFRYHPPIRGRADIFRLSALGDNRGHSHDWVRRQRVQLDSLAFPGGHPFASWWNRFHETHREFFALQPDGERSGFPNPRTVKLCKSNPAVWDQWLRDVEAARERDPNTIVFGANANDSWNRGYCICKNCLAWDHQDADKIRYSWQGLSQEYVAMSDRQITFANTLARMLEARFPGEGLFASAMAYGASRPAPVGVTPDDNVIVALVANIHNRPGAEPSRERLRKWAAVTKHFAWRPNLGGAAGWKSGLPNVAPRRVMEDFRFVADHNVIAIFFDTLWENWANQGPHYYMLAQMAWNPHADGEAILADYYQRAFGPAVEPMTAYWSLLERAADAIVHQGQPQSEVWSATFFDRAYTHLDRAADALADAPARFGERLAFVRAGLDYTRLYLERQTLMSRLRDPDSTPDPELKTTLRANWEEMEPILEAHPTTIYKHFARRLRNDTLTAIE